MIGQITAIKKGKKLVEDGDHLVEVAVIGQDQKRKGGQGHPVAVVVAAAAAAGKGHHQRGSQGQSLLQGKIRTSTFLKT